MDSQIPFAQRDAHFYVIFVKVFFFKKKIMFFLPYASHLLINLCSPLCSSLTHKLPTIF